MQNQWDGKAASIELSAKLVEPRGSEEELAEVKAPMRMEQPLRPMVEESVRCLQLYIMQ